MESASRASSNQVNDRVFQSVGQTVPCLHTTSVMRPSSDLRANSSGKFGPSSRHSCEIGKALDSQINDPQPRQTSPPKFSLPFILVSGNCWIHFSSATPRRLTKASIGVWNPSIYAVLS